MTYICDAPKDALFNLIFMIYLEFLVITVWCGLGASAFATKAFGSDYDLGVRSFKIFLLYIGIWFGSAYIVFELGKSPVGQLIKLEVLLLFLVLLLSYWPIKEAVRLAPIVGKLVRK
jgi:hypothetical protein